MDRMILTLKQRAESARLGDQATWDAFALMVAACSYCCTNHVGGNETCPPKPVIIEE